MPTTYYVLQKTHGDREGGYVVLLESGAFDVTFQSENATKFTGSQSALAAVARRAVLYASDPFSYNQNAADTFRLVEINYIVPPPPPPGAWKLGRTL
jgi:hypothetical protein